MAEAGVQPDVVHTSLQTRAIRTAEHGPARRWAARGSRSGATGGSTSATTGTSPAATRRRPPSATAPTRCKVWRRSYDVPPPADRGRQPVQPERRRALRRVPPDVAPATECLADVVARLLPYWDDAHRHRSAGRAHGPGRRPRQQPPRPREAPRRHQRRGHRRAQHPHRRAARLRPRCALDLRRRVVEERYLRDPRHRRGGGSGTAGHAAPPGDLQVAQVTRPRGGPAVQAVSARRRRAWPARAGSRATGPSGWRGRGGSSRRRSRSMWTSSALRPGDPAGQPARPRASRRHDRAEAIEQGGGEAGLDGRQRHPAVAEPEDAVVVELGRRRLPLPRSADAARRPGRGGRRRGRARGSSPRGRLRRRGARRRPRAGGAAADAARASARHGGPESAGQRTRTTSTAPTVGRERFAAVSPL